MRPIPDSYSIVVLGAWNPSIFTPEWIVSNLAEGVDLHGNLTRVLHRKLTRLDRPDYGPVWLWVASFSLPLMCC